MVVTLGRLRQRRLRRWWHALWLQRVPKKHFERTRERAILLGWLLGLFSIIPDIAVTVITHSVTILTDVFRTGTDTLAGFLSWLTVRKIARGHTAKYNYGYGKLESLASLAVAGAMMISFFIIVFSAIGRLHEPVKIERVTIGIIFTAIAGLTNTCCWVRNRSLAKREPSPVMESQWRLFRAKTLINICVLISLVLTAIFREYTWAVFIDPVASLLLASFLVFSAYQIVSASVYDLLDRSVEESLGIIIDNELKAFAGRYVAFHGIRSRKSGGQMYIELFLEFNQEDRMGEVHQLIDQISRNLEKKIPDSHIMIVPSHQSVRYAVV